MAQLIDEKAFDAIAGNRDQFRRLFREYSDATKEFVDLDQTPKRLAKATGEPHSGEPVYAPLARVLNALYLDAVANNDANRTWDSRLQSGLSGALKRRNSSIEEFIVHSMERCAEELAVSFKSENSKKHNLRCSILCCGVLAGVGLLLNSAIQSNRARARPKFAPPGELKGILLKLDLSLRFMNIDNYLQSWIGNFWRTQEVTSSFRQSALSDGGSIFDMFWTMHVPHLYEEVQRLLGRIEQSAEDEEVRRLLGVNAKQVTDLRGGVASIAEAHVMAWITGFHSGLVQSLSLDTLYWLLIYFMNSGKLERENICAYVLDVVFSKFSANGCLSLAGSDPSPVVNLGKSTEVLAILLYCDLLRRKELIREELKAANKQRAVSLGSLPPSLFAKHYDQVVDHLSALKTVHERRRLYRGSAEGVDRHFWCLCLISCGILLADELLDRHARAALRVEQFVPEPPGDYPEELQFLKEDVIDQIRRGGEARKQASYSMIFYGAPGSAKTTLAQNIAYDLDWSFLEIGSRDFLREGADQIDAQADRVFRYCGYLRDVVILFDELEELILERETKEIDKASRLLTTSMLPRIQQLRNQQSVVFIFATNRLESLDIAATRLGRFDIIKYVRYPDVKVKRKFLKDKTKNDRNPILTEAFAKFLRRTNAELEDLTCNMAFGDLTYILGQVRKAAEQAKDDAALRDEIFAIFHSNKPGDEIKRRVEAFETLSARDRPPSRKSTGEHPRNGENKEKASAAAEVGQIAANSATAVANAGDPKTK